MYTRSPAYGWRGCTGSWLQVLRGLAQSVDVREIELRRNALREQVQRDVHDIDVAGALTVTEQRAFDAVGTGHDAQLGRRNTGAAVIVRVQAQHDAVPVLDVAAEPLDLVRVDIGRGHLDRGRQVEDDLVLRRRLPHIHHRLAHLPGVVQLGAGEALGRVLKHDLGAVHVLGEPARQPCTAHRNLGDALALEAEHDPPLQRGSRVVKMKDGPVRAPDALEGALDQGLAGLAQYLDGDVRGNAVFLDDLAHEVEVGLRGRRKTNLDLLETHAHQRLEHAQLALRVHRIDQGLVTVAQIHAAPHGRLGDGAGRPLAIGEIDRLEGLIFVDGHGARRAFGGSRHGRDRPAVLNRNRRHGLLTWAPKRSCSQRIRGRLTEPQRAEHRLRERQPTEHRNHLRQNPRLRRGPTTKRILPSLVPIPKRATGSGGHARETTGKKDRAPSLRNPGRTGLFSSLSWRQAPAPRHRPARVQTDTPDRTDTRVRAAPRAAPRSPRPRR